VDYVFQFGLVWREIDALLLGAWLTIRLSALAMVLGLVVGVVGALATASRWRAVRALARAYVEAIRNTPFLVQVLFVYLGLPSLGLRLRPDQAALLAMVINLGAYATEIVRAGVTALGFTPWQLFRFVVWLPALRAVFPALGSQFILIMLASSVVSVISAEELTAVADTIVARNFRSFEVYLVVTGLYLAMCLAFQATFAAVHRALFARWGGA
jgi:polar amino acid transport system permease protein